MWQIQTKPEIKKIDVKHFVTTLMLARFLDRRIQLLDHPQAWVEYQSEVRKATSGRYSHKEWIYSSSKGDHIIDATRILEYMLYLAITRQRGQLMPIQDIFSSPFIKLGRL